MSSNWKLNWTSSDPTIASVNENGLVTANAIGNTNILLNVGNLNVSTNVTIKAPRIPNKPFDIYDIKPIYCVQLYGTLPDVSDMFSHIKAVSFKAKFYDDDPSAILDIAGYLTGWPHDAGWLPGEIRMGLSQFDGDYYTGTGWGRNDYDLYAGKPEYDTIALGPPVWDGAPDHYGEYKFIIRNEANNELLYTSEETYMFDVDIPGYE